MTKFALERAEDYEDLSRKAAQIIASHIDLALDQRDRAQVALSGGSTPALTYELLGEEHLPWDRVDIFLADERWVDLRDKESNSRLIRHSLLAGGPGSKASFHPIPTVELPNSIASASAFSDLICKNCPGEPPILDLIVLGLGEDGHTASLFPESEALSVTDKFAIATEGKGLQRVSLTSLVINSARKVVFLVSGKDKQKALRRLLDPNEPFQRTPARLVQPATTPVILADNAATEDLSNDK